MFCEKLNQTKLGLGKWLMACVIAFTIYGCNNNPTETINQTSANASDFIIYQSDSLIIKQLAPILHKKGNVWAQNSFDGLLKVNLGGDTVVAQYLGKGHTIDNIVGYFAKDKALFGGCLIKEMNAGKGNLEDASVKDWSNTVEQLKLAFPEAIIVIPGHGNAGGRKLLDYTIDLFSEKTPNQ